VNTDFSFRVFLYSKSLPGILEAKPNKISIRSTACVTSESCVLNTCYKYLLAHSNVT
jgi:hypothetical protein